MPGSSSTFRAARAVWLRSLFLGSASLSACAAIWGFQDTIERVGARRR